MLRIIKTTFTALCATLLVSSCGSSSKAIRSDGQRPSASTDPEIVALLATPTDTIPWNMGGSSGDDVIDKVLSVDFAPTRSLWGEKPDEPIMEVLIVSPKDLGFGKRYTHRAFIKMVIDAGWGNVHLWLVPQMYFDIPPPEKPVWFCMAPVQTKEGLCVYRMGPNSLAANNFHDIFWAKVKKEYARYDKWVFARPVKIKKK